VSRPRVRRARDPPLEFGARSVRGFGGVALGDVPGGMRDLDEASAAAVAGEVWNPMMAGLVWCNVIYACERVHDVERAAQWCAIVREQAERIQTRQMFGFCRSHYARVLIARGEWRQAEAELELAHSDLSAAAPAGVYEAALALAELRRRRARFDEATSLCRSCEWHRARNCAWLRSRGTAVTQPARVSCLPGGSVACQRRPGSAMQWGSGLRCASRSRRVTARAPVNRARHWTGWPRQQTRPLFSVCSVRCRHRGNPVRFSGGANRTRGRR
jgi:hypothetical protein